jgi:hypothetical protein
LWRWDRNSHSTSRKTQRWRRRHEEDSRRGDRGTHTGWTRERHEETRHTVLEYGVKGQHEARVTELLEGYEERDEGIEEDGR